MIIVNDKTTPVELLGREMIAYSQEAVSVLKSFAYIKRALPSLSHRLKAMMGISHALNDQNFMVLNDWVFKSISSKNYGSLRNKKVMIPKGMGVTYLEFIAGMQTNQKVVDGIISNILAPAEKFLGRIANDPTVLGSLKPTDLTRSVNLHNVEQIRKNTAKLYTKDQAEKRKYEEVIRRQADVLPAVKGYNQLVEDVSRIDRSEVFNYLNRIVTLTDSIIETFETENTDVSVSKTAINSLGVFIHQIAQHIELYATHCFTIEALGASLDNIRKATK